MGRFTKKEWDALTMFRVLKLAKMYGQSPSTVLDWSAEEFAWAEGLELYEQAEMAKAASFRRRK